MNLQPDHVQPDPDLPQRRRRQLRRAAWIAALVLVLAAALFAAVAPQAWAALPRTMAAVKPALVVLHLVLIALLWLRWSVVIAWLHRHGWVHAQKVKLALSMRGQVVTLLLVLELVVVVRWPLDWL